MTGALLDLLRQARQRVIGNLMIEQASLGLTLGLACGVLLLLLGTQILDWYWPLLLFAGAFALGVARFWRDLPGDYRIAQMLDQRLTLPDTLSTAFHFAQPAAKPHSEHLRDLQRQQAEEAARQADVGTALPWRWNQLSMAAGVLAVVFASLMLYRYGTQNSLDLSRPLVPGLVDLFGTADSSGSALAQFPQKTSDGPQPEPLSGTAQSEDERKLDEALALSEAPEDVLKTIGVPEVDNSSAEQSKKGDIGKEGGQDGKENENTEGEKGDAASGDEAGSKSDPGSKDGKKDAANAPNGKQQQPGDNNTLMDKFRDALANMMNKMKQPGNQGKEQIAKNEGPKDGQGQGKGEKPKDGQKGQPNEGKPNAQGGEGEQKGDSEAKSGDQDQNAQGKGSSESNQPKGGDDPKSGTGKQDGSKDIQLAMHNAEALGKLSEIIGKRSEKQTGDLMVEVSSGRNQQLRTGYSAKTAQHADTGGEIHRDEVPLQYQQYVQSYFEQLRRAAPAPAAAAAAAAPAAVTPARPAK